MLHRAVRSRSVRGHSNERLGLKVEQSSNEGKGMSNIISFLERMGQDADLRIAGVAIAETELARTQLADNARIAVLNNDYAALAVMVGAGPVICCGMAPGRKDEEEEEEEPGNEDEVRALRVA